ncbi:MAG: homoserine dehydrogenase [Candidatus Omnitrophica bacterium]|nr:homoserine dehydrogenase [Candidatus Omnitrophota bacterium]
MKKIYLGLLGYGNVGKATAKLLKQRRSLLKKRAGCDLVLKKICDKNDNPYEILRDPNIDIVIELIGGIHPAKEYISEAIDKGKFVVTANKALLAEEGKYLFNKAKEKGKSIYFEASVGAGIPIIKSLKEGLSADRFNGIFGILNGTSNFILSQMSYLGIEFKSALRQTQKSGFAERDVNLDVEGIDSAHKLLLLVYLCFGKFFNLKDVFVEGITEILALDIVYARELGFTIKLLAVAKREGADLELRVHPALLPSPHPLANVDGINNAIYVSSDLAGDLLFYGPGAGRNAAASAVISDLISAALNIQAGLFRKGVCVVEDTAVKRLRHIKETESRYYIRFLAEDKHGVLANISGILAKYKISIASVTQKQRKRADVVPIVMILHKAKEKDLRIALEKIAGLPVIHEKPLAIRIEEP